MARLSLCFGAAVLAAALVLLWAARAEAAPATPVLTGTDPVSPGLSLTPAVQGSSTGVIKSSFPGLRTSAITFAGGPGNTIYLYPNKSCAGTPFGEGSASELDHAGIPVTVAAESTTFVTAEQEDEFGSFSGCSNAIEYRQVKELPKTEEPEGGVTVARRPRPVLRTCARFPGAGRTTPRRWSRDRLQGRIW